MLTFGIVPLCTEDYDMADPGVDDTATVDEEELVKVDMAIENMGVSTARVCMHCFKSDMLTSFHQAMCSYSVPV